MKALAVVEDTDPQGTVVGVLGVVDLPQSRLHLALWYLGLAAVILLMAFVCLRTANGAAADDLVILQESGHFNGTGYHEISASGPLCSLTILPGNESLLTAGNGTVWIVQQNGSLVEVV
jgi:hypothetical protein